MSKFPGKVCNFIHRHRRKFIFAGVLVGGVVGTVKFAQYKIKTWMAEEEKRYLEELKKQQHFEKTQEHCHAIVAAVVKALKEDILVEVDTDPVTTSLKSEKSSEKKLELWNELKILVFTRIATCIYVIVLSTVIIRLQLNQLASKVYASTTQGKVQIINEETQRWFLSLAHEHTRENGLCPLVAELQKILQDLAESLPLQCSIKGSDLDSLFKSIHERVRNNSHLSFNLTDEGFDIQPNIISMFMPEVSKVNYKTSDNIEVKQQLVNEIWDIMDSEDCRKVLDNSVAKAFKDFAKIVGDKITGKKKHGEGNDLMLCESSESPSLPLAKVLPLLNSLVHTITSDAFIHKILANHLLSNFSANIYESFTEKQN